MELAKYFINRAGHQHLYTESLELKGPTDFAHAEVLCVVAPTPLRLCKRVPNISGAERRTVGYEHAYEQAMRGEGCVFAVAYEDYVKINALPEWEVDVTKMVPVLQHCAKTPRLTILGDNYIGLLGTLTLSVERDVLVKAKTYWDLRSDEGGFHVDAEAFYKLKEVPLPKLPSLEEFLLTL